MPCHKLDPDDPNPTEIFTLRLTRRDVVGLRDLARAEDRQPTAQARHLIRQALNLSTPRAQTPDEDR